MKQVMSVVARLTGSAALTLVALQCHGVELSGQVNLEHRQFFLTVYKVRIKRKVRWCYNPNYFGKLASSRSLLSRRFIALTVWMMSAATVIFVKPYS